MKIQELLEDTTSHTVQELFQQGKDWKWSFQGSEEAVAVFHVGEIPYMFHAYGTDGVWEVEFKRHGSKLDRSTKFGLTGTGNSAEVMSTVVDIMRAFLDKYKGKIETLVFSAKEDSRQSLYAKMTKRLLPNWSLHQDGGEFTLVSPEQNNINSKELIPELFEPEQASPLDWSKGLNSTYAEGQIEINGHSVSIDITFTNMEDGIVDIEFAVGGQFDLTGRGGASQVFATVINAIKEFVADHPKITTITFTAHEQSRAKMYDTLAKRVSKQVGWHVIPYDEMIADPRLHGNSGEFTFAIQKGQAPAHRQAAQKPQHGEFVPVFYVYAYENPKLPVIKIKAKKSMDAEMWAIKNVPGYDNEHPMSIFTTKTPPEGRTDIVDKGEVPAPKKSAPQDPNSLGAQLRAKLSTPAQ